MSNNTTVQGTDGVSPILSTGRWSMWAMNDIYTGDAGTNKYIPKVNDYIIDPETYTTYIVDVVDGTTFVPSLRKIIPNMTDAGFQPEYMVAPPGVNQADTYRAYLDTSVTPHILAVDSRLTVAGSMSSYAKIFKGSSLGGTGTVISRMYDNAGIDLGENVPLEIVAVEDMTNISIRNIPPCNTNDALTDGEIVTVVIYTIDGAVVSKQQCLIENTGYIRNTNPVGRTIDRVELSSPFLSATTTELLELPIGTPLSSMPLYGIVHYTDGTEMKLPVDGTKFRVHGLEQYVASVLGERINIVLTYRLSDEERLVGSGDEHISVAYKLVTTDVTNSYKIMIQSYPEWKGAAIGYIPRHFMINADRTSWWDVTNEVRYEENFGAFDATAYGIIQRKAVSLNLADVSPSYNTFNHVQRINYLLDGPPSGSQSNWRVDMTANGSTLEYGGGLTAGKVANTVGTVFVDSNINDLEDWLDAVYYRSSPVLNTVTEVIPPRPTHFYVTYNGEEVLISLENYREQIMFGNTVTVYDNVYLRFIRLTGATETVLGVSGMQLVPN